MFADLQGLVATAAEVVAADGAFQAAMDNRNVAVAAEAAAKGERSGWIAPGE